MRVNFITINSHAGGLENATILNWKKKEKGSRREFFQGKIEIDRIVWGWLVISTQETEQTKKSGIYQL